VLRVLAATLATMGRTGEARAIIDDLRKNDPELTISSWRARTMFYDQRVFDKLGGGLRLAGLPD
jgi:hypothetical protein